MDKTTSPQARHQSILQAIDRGESAAQIALALGTTAPAIRSYLKRQGLKAKRPQHHRWIAVDYSQVQVLLDSGLTQWQIAEQLGVSLNTIERRVREQGLRTARTGPRFAQGHKSCWKGGRKLAKHGYVEVYVPLHPQAKRNSGCVPEHRLVMELVLGRYLDPKEVVHHHDDHPHHNWPENLGLFASNADHLRHELTGRPQASPRSSIPGAYGSNQTIDRCPEIHETLGQAASEIRPRLEQYMAAHRPTTAHQTLPLRSILRAGAHQPVFQSGCGD